MERKDEVGTSITVVELLSEYNFSMAILSSDELVVEEPPSSLSFTSFSPTLLFFLPLNISTGSSPSIFGLCLKKKIPRWFMLPEVEVNCLRHRCSPHASMLRDVLF